jgi:hypothetical protein
LTNEISRLILKIDKKKYHFWGIFALKKGKNIKKISLKNKNKRNLKLLGLPSHPGAKVDSARTIYM